MPPHSRNSSGNTAGNPLSALLDKIPLGRPQLLAIGGVIIVVIGVVVGLAVSGGGKPAAARQRHTTSSSSTSTVPTTTIPQFPSNYCPLTDTPAPGGVAPNRPALAVKIGNEPGNDPAAGAGARPQSGLNEADIVYDTPTEGFLMRYMAVFQCQDASSIGPIRSVRWVDWHILRQFVHPILTFAGGIIPDVNDVLKSKWIMPADVIAAQSGAASQLATRAAPDATYSSTSALYGLYPKATTKPRPVFRYSTAVPAGATPAADLTIDFSYGTDVLWKWNAATGQWDHYYLYSGTPTPDIDTLTNKQVSTSNIVVQIVKYHFGPYAESPGSTGDFEAGTVGTGPGYVLRDGKVIKVTWRRDTLLSPMTFTDANGKTVALAPGRTWVELVPNTTAAKAGNVVITK